MQQVAGMLIQILVVGALITFISDSNTFINMHRNILADIIYGTEYLQGLDTKEINNIWRKVSKVMFNDKFGAIHDQVLSNIVDTYMPQDQISYYKDYKTNIKMEWSPENGNFIIEDRVDIFNLIADREEKFDFIQKHSFHVGNITEGDDSNQYSIHWSITINGIQYNESEIDGTTNPYFTKRLDNGHCVIEFKKELQGSCQYEVIKKQTKRYNIKEDGYIGFKAKYLTDSLNLSLTLPSGLKPCMIERGTKNKFIEIDEASLWIYQYNGLILPEQGYIIILEKQDKS